MVTAAISWYSDKSELAWYHDRQTILEGTTNSEVFAKHLNAKARKAYIQTEANELIIRRALRTKVRAAEQIYEHEDVVYYKRDGKDWWLGGPANEVFQNGKVVFVRHGGVFGQGITKQIK